MKRNTSQLWSLLSALLLAGTVGAGSAFAGTIDLAQTGQVGCWDSAGAVIDCDGTGQDGDFRAGIAWPDPRFVDNGDGTLTDLLTGLMWLQDVECLGTAAWIDTPGRLGDFNASPGSYSCSSYTAVHSDWRAPNISELLSLRPFRDADGLQWLADQGFVNTATATAFGWPSTEKAETSAQAWFVDFNTFSFNLSANVTALGAVWAVRAGANETPDPATPANVWKTGKTTCWNDQGVEIDCAGTGRDGELQRGVAWPEPRFVDNGDGTVSDKLTGLMWLRHTQCLGGMVWQAALDAVASFNADPASSGCTGYTATYDDWRLPNFWELYSLHDFESESPAVPPEAESLFLTISATGYWTSTTSVLNTTAAFMIEIGGFGYCPANTKSSDHRIVWPVRRRPSGGIFEDGFESGDTTMW